MSTLAKRNNPFRIFLLIFAVGIVIWSVYQERKPADHQASLEFRMITGYENGVFQLIMVETPDRIFVLDSTFRDQFQNNTAETVTGPEQLALMEKYDQLQFRAGYHILGSDQKKEVRMTRELFNALRFEAPQEILIAPKVKDSLIQIQ